mmetsp:Transcript_20348/g.43599  ORF Transcript_20348/g.43599 Transcript_20348/m.43599 type:complete len:492 (+) Transcript_20348:63-1538(+)
MAGAGGRKRSSPPLLSLKTQYHLFILFLLILVFQTLLLASKLSFETSTDGHPSSAPDAVGDPSLSASASDPRVTGQILPDGTVTFTPQEFRAGRPENYVNLPNVPLDPHRDGEVRKLMAAAVPPPAETLLHLAPTPPGSNAILGLASYPEFMDGWRKLVGSLRMNGYDGHVIVGVNPAIPRDERDYLDRMGVTYYAVEVANCTASILEGSSDAGKNAVRAKCSRGMEDLKLEWGRFEMARRWLGACESCTGWSMVIDTRDIFFQADPFASLGNPAASEQNLLFVEEIAKYTNTLPETPHRAVNLGESMRYKVHVHPCYGKGNVRAQELMDRPMLCSGTVIGTRDGMHRFLSVLVDEFRRNNARGPSCRSPSTTDQWTMNHLYYGGRFGFVGETRTLPWGTGPVLTVGKPCVNSAISKKGGSQKDMMVFDTNTGVVLNPHEVEGSVARVAPTLHQWDRCRRWINPWFEEHRNLYRTNERLEDEPAVPWVESE